MRVKTYSTFDIAGMLEVVPGTVANWIDSGKLKAFATLGGHRRVSREDLLAFLRDNAIPVPEPLANSSGKKKILIVEDDEKFLNLVVKALKTFKDFELLTATDGFQAGQLVEGRKPDLVVLDIMLPDINGFKVCELIKARNKSTRVIAITGYDSEDIKSKILGAGADVYLIKPFQFKTLFGHVESLLTER
jgi:excisionase family DNA binding protein